MEENPVIGFAKDLFLELEKLRLTVPDSLFIRPEKLKDQLSIISLQLINRWGKKLPLSIIIRKSYGNNVIIGEEALHVPIAFWKMRASIRIFLKIYQNWISTLPNDITWSEFTKTLYNILYEVSDSSYGITIRQAEIIRFHSRVFLFDPYIYLLKQSLDRRKLFEQYIPRYIPHISYDRINKNYNAIVASDTDWDLMPNYNFWNLSIMLGTSDSEIGDQKMIKSFPFWRMIGIDNTPSRGNELVMHLIDNNNSEIMYDLGFHKISKVQLFWYMNHYVPKHTKVIKGRLKLSITSPWEQYLTYENQGYNLIDSFQLDKDSRLKEASDILFAPDWLLEQKFQNKNLNNHQNVSNYPKREKLITIIQDYITRSTKREFYSRFKEDSAKSFLDLLFYKRLYLLNVPSFERGIIWLRFQSKNSNNEIMLNFITGWLFRGPIFEYDEGIIIFSYFSKNICRKEEQDDIRDFFNTFDIDCKIYIHDSIHLNDHISFHFLPKARFFDEQEHRWNLPDTSIHFSERESRSRRSFPI